MPKAQTLSLIHRFILHPAVVLLSGALFYFACLRETPSFWTNAGGYPLWLRDLVLEGFYPLLFMYVGLVAHLSWEAITKPARVATFLWLEVCSLLLLWAAGGLTITIVVANNVTNLLEGRPFHSHTSSGAP